MLSDSTQLSSEWEEESGSESESDSSSSASLSSGSSSHPSQPNHTSSNLPEWVPSSFHLFNPPFRGTESIHSALIAAHQVLDDFRSVSESSWNLIRWSHLLECLRHLQAKGFLGRDIATRYPSLFITSNQIKQRRNRTRSTRKSKEKGKEMEIQVESQPDSDSDSQNPFNKSLARLLFRLSLPFSRSGFDGTTPQRDKSSSFRIIHSKEYKRSLQADEARALSKVIQLCRPLFSNDVVSDQMNSFSEIDTHGNEMDDLEEVLNKQRVTLQESPSLGETGQVEEDYSNIYTAASSLLTSIESFLINPPSRNMVLYIDKNQCSQSQSSSSSHFSKSSSQVFHFLQRCVGGQEERKERFMNVTKLAIVENFESGDFPTWQPVLSSLILYLPNLENLLIQSKSLSTLSDLFQTESYYLSSDPKSSSKKFKSNIDFSLPPSISTLKHLSSITLETKQSQIKNSSSTSKSIANSLSKTMKMKMKMKEKEKTKTKTKNQIIQFNFKLPSLLSMAIQSFQSFCSDSSQSFEETSSSSENVKEDFLSDLPSHLFKLIKESYLCISCERFILSNSSNYISPFTERIFHLDPPLSSIDSKVIVEAIKQRSRRQNEKEKGFCRVTELVFGDQYHLLSSTKFENTSRDREKKVEGEVEEKREANIENVLKFDWRFCETCACLHLFSHQTKTALGIEGSCQCMLCKHHWGIVKDGEDLTWYRDRDV